MDSFFTILLGLLSLMIPILIVVGIVYFILRMGSKESIRFSHRHALRIYFYIVTLISIGLGGARWDVHPD